MAVQATLDALLASPPPDLLRLVVVPVLGWAAYRDVRTRRVPNVVWLPLVSLGAVLLVGDYFLAGPSAYRRQLLLVRVGISLLFVAPLGYVFYRLGAFGGADAKAVMTLAVVVPTYPTYYLPSTALPVVVAPLGVFSLTVLSNTVLAGLAYPVALTARNLLAGRVALPMAVARPVPVRAIPTAYGRLLETPDGFTRRGLDLDALRMYLRWRGATLAELRADPDRLRDPRSVPPPDERGRPGDGALADGPGVAGDLGSDPDSDSESGVDPARDRADGGAHRRSRPPARDRTPEAHADLTPAIVPADEWAAAEFLASVDGAYGATPETLRDGLETLVDAETVWVTPGIPFVVPTFVGLVAGVTAGDALYAVLAALGLA